MSKKNPSITDLIKEGQNVFKKTPALRIFQDLNENSKAYSKKQHHVELRFKKVLEEANAKYAESLFKEDKNGVPHIYAMTSDTNNKATHAQKALLMGDALKLFVVSVKNERDGSDLEPSTMNTFLRTFLSHIKIKYGVNLSLKDDFKGTGGLLGK